MSFPPGVPMPMTRPLYATSTGAMMVQMAPVRPVTMVPVSQVMVTPVMRPTLTQSQGFVPHMSTQPVVSNQSQNSSKIVIQAEPTKNPNYVKPEDAAQQNGNEGDPAITVFVGNITDRASDTLVRQILMKCGSVQSWKRVQGASGKLQAFGFCEYKDPESALRAIHILHDYKLGDKKLLVKVDAKTQEVIDEWKKRKGLATNEDHKLPGIDAALAGLHGLIQEYLSELSMAKPSVEKDEMIEILKPDPTVRESHNVEENLEELELEEDQKTFISKEIRTFRATQKLEEERLKNLKDDKDKPRSTDEKERSSLGTSRSRKKEKESRDREKDRDRDKDRDRRDRDRDRSERDRDRSDKDRDRSDKDRDRSDKDRDRRDRDKDRERDRERRARSPVRNRRSRSASPRRVETRRSPIRRRSRTPPRPLASRRSPPRRNNRSPAALRKRTSSRSPVSWRRGDDDEEYEAQERRKLERKIKEKEAAYQERLRTIEMRERRQKRTQEKREQRQAQERKEMVKEAKRLREFLADYEDDRSDNKYYIGNALTKRLREREREIESDERDRKKEKEEIETLRKRLLEENDPNPEAAIKKFMEESDSAWRPLIEPDTPPRKSPAASPAPAASSSSSDDEEDSGSDEDSEKSDSESSVEPAKKAKKERDAQQMVATLQPVKDELPEVDSAPPVAAPAPIKVEPVVKMEFSAVKSSPSRSASATSSPQVKTEVKLEPMIESINPTTLSSKRRKLKVSDVFNQDEEEDELPKKRKLVPLQYTDAEKDALNPTKAVEEKRKQIRALIERIPTQKDDLFDYNLDWSMVDPTLMEKRIQPWISKKILEYIGEEEPTLVEFICSKIMTKSSPEKILEDIAMVLDDEADVFVVKMWRLLIYETEAKKEGLNK